MGACFDAIDGDERDLLADSLTQSFRVGLAGHRPGFGEFEIQDRIVERPSAQFAAGRDVLDPSR